MFDKKKMNQQRFSEAGFLFKPAILAVCVTALLTGCATRDKNPQPDPFMDHWKEQAIERQGFSPAEEDLMPEPRVLMKQTDKVLEGSLRPLPTKAVSLKLQNAPISTVLRALAATVDVSILFSGNLSENVSVNVENAKWSDVFEGLLRSHGLDWRWQGKILQVLTAEEKQREVGLMTLNNQLAEQYMTASHSGPMTVQVVNVRYSDAAALKKSLEKFVSRNKDAVIEIDEHNNALILQGTAVEQARMLALVEHLDRPRPQVLLKAYIVETTKEKARELGMQWGGRYMGRGGHNNQIIGGSGGTNLNPGGDGAENTISQFPMGLNYGSLVNSSGVGNIGLAFGQLGGNILETQLNLMEREGVLNILSSPSITTLDNKMAYTENGEKVPYVSRDDEGDNDVKFEEAVLRLEMTPNVIDRSNMKLKVLIKKDEVDSSRNVEGNPYIIKKQTETTVMVRSGETIVLSGLTKEKGNDSDAGVPGMRDLPGGKYAFGSTNRTVSMEEVLIFITPTILPTRTEADRKAKPLKMAPIVKEAPKKEEKKAADDQVVTLREGV